MMKKAIICALAASAIVALSSCKEEKASSTAAPDGFDAAFCETVHNTATADIDTAMISRMVEQAKILKPMFEPGSKANFASADDSVTRQNAYDNVSGKLYELLLAGRIDRALIDQVNGYDAVPLPENDTEK